MARKDDFQERRKHKGAVHYQKSFKVEYGNEGFAESISISAHALSDAFSGFINLTSASSLC